MESAESNPIKAFFSLVINFISKFFTTLFLTNDSSKETLLLSSKNKFNSVDVFPINSSFEYPLLRQKPHLHL